MLPAAEAGATGLGVHVDMAPETMREVGPLPGEAFAAPSLLSPRQRGRAWPQGLLGPQNGAVSKVRPSSKHPVKTRWGTGPGWGLPGTAPRPARAPPGLYHVAGGQPGFQSPVSGRDKHRSHHVALRKLCCSLKLGRLGQARPPRGPDSPGPPVRQAGHLAATHSLPLPCPALCPQPQPQEPCGAGLGLSLQRDEVAPRQVEGVPMRRRANVKYRQLRRATRGPCVWAACQPAHPGGRHALAQPGPTDLISRR